MSTTMTDLASAVASAGGTPSAFGKDDQPGKTVTGTIVESQLRQVTNFETGEPETWNDGSPKQQVVVTIQTTDHSQGPDDDGRRRVYVKFWGDQRRNLIAAIKNSGDTDLRVGGAFTATYTGDGEAPKRGFSAPKLYAYDYTPPASGVAQAVQAQAPAPAAAAAPAQQEAPEWGPPAPAVDPGIASKVTQMRGLGLADEQIATALSIDTATVGAVPF